MHNIFIDESCHLEHDNIPVMCIGYIKVPKDQYIQLKEQFEQLKLKFRTPVELKWNKFSNSRLPFYKALVDFFFASPLEFRCILVKYKNRLNHIDFNNGSHDNFYYKLIYFLLKSNPSDEQYRVYLDIKDTRGKEKLNKIHEIFTSYYNGESPFSHLQHIRSHDNVFIQLADFFIGAITYKTRMRLNSELNHPGRLEFIEYLEDASGFSLDEGTVPWETKFNIFDHQPKKSE
ncbi:DUF3800 domain-containing protein [Psychroflexus lacisalsi]|jgi:hypothetical protein|uniref:DUF3800 domain-containing protein n=1 Tax=Psychroflexus lacisalsi TaxID=503928 RepID=A0ABN1K0Z9_9FLAO|nr:DUF3800 domain-containing protein [Psychroflexus lacisalsi]MBZ9620734.1 DUF3800 domain-containing protein [Psychroflexus lacisalsi]